MVGLNFANEREATQFFKAVDAKVNERQEKRASEFGYIIFAVRKSSVVCAVITV